MGNMNNFGGAMMGFASLYTLLAFAMPMFLTAFLVIYLLGIFDRRSGERDPMLGVKVLLTLLMSVSFHLVLLGVAILVAIILDDKADDAFKKAGGLLIGGGVSGAYSLGVYFARVHGQGNLRVVRQTLGLNAISTGGVFIAALTMVITMVINDTEGTSWPASFTIVYFLGNIVCTFPLLSDSLSSDSAV